jgi:hypothetical protein
MLKKWPINYQLSNYDQMIKVLNIIYKKGTAHC